MAQWPELQEEISARDEYIKQVAKRDKVDIKRVKETVAGIKTDGSGGYKWVSYPYHDERQQFNALVDELYVKNKDDFESREQVFDLFANATLTGRLLTVARLIEKTFGKGSFRMIGERSADKSDRDGSV